MAWNKPIPQNEIEEKITDETIHFAEEFGKYLAKSDTYVDNKGKTKDSKNALTTNQLRKFFGEVKRQQLRGYQPTEFILLKPKLAYAVGRADKGSKIADFYFVIAQGIDRVHTDAEFKNFIKIFEVIVAYHKAYEEKKS